METEQEKAARLFLLSKNKSTLYGGGETVKEATFTTKQRDLLAPSWLDRLGISPTILVLALSGAVGLYILLRK